MSPTLARRFPVGPGDGTPTRWYLHCPYCLKSLPDHLLSAVPARYRRTRLLQDGAAPGRAAARAGPREEARADLTPRRLGGELVGMENHVVGDHEGTRLE